MVSETSDTSNATASSAAASTPANAASSNTLTSNGFASSPTSITPIVATDQQQMVSGLLGTSVSHSVVTSSTTGVEPSTAVTVSTAPTTVAGSSGVAASSLDSKIPSIVENQATHDSTSSVNGAPLQDMEEAKRGLPVVGPTNVTPSAEKTNDGETFVYANKQVRILYVMYNLLY
ncbi:spore coat protein SP96-like [Trifolium pratense]|uniref:spore coat protein SP96-like n=1 Tax=Trifolium pratense TaxID=57577 RepID=UPI001E690394|nr:spore coat protein SP96-like [Trifolium pratense]